MKEYYEKLSKLRIEMDKLYSMNSEVEYSKKDLDQLDAINIKVDEALGLILDWLKSKGEK